MKINYLFFIITVMAIFLAESCSSHNKKCTIRGTTHGVEDDTLILVKMGESFLFEGIEIPIVDSSFKYEFDLVHPEACRLFFHEARNQGGGARLLFFIEPEEINITLYSEEEFNKCKVEGDKINKIYKEYQNQVDTLFWSRIMPLSDSLIALSRMGNYYSDTMKYIHEKYKMAADQNEKDKLSNIMNDLYTSNQHLSGPAQLLKDKSDSIVMEMTKWEQEYISKNPSIVSYYLLYSNVMYEEDKIDLDKQNRIWDKYGISNAAGGSYLIDRDGTILTVNPSAEETREKLKELLN